MSPRASAGRIEGHDIEEYNRIATPWQVVLRQMSGGSFRAGADYLTVNGLLLYREHFNRRVVVTGAAPEGFLMLGGPLTPSTHVDWCGVDLSSQCLAFATSSAEVDFILPDESRHWALLVPEDLLLPHLDHGPPASEQLRSLRHMLVAPEQSRALTKLVHRLIDNYLAHGDLLADEQECQIVTSQLVETFAKIVQSSPMLKDNNGSSLRARRLALRRAIEYAECHSGSITVPQLATAAGVSQRVLELAFSETLGISPLSYLRRNRMNQAYRTLRTAPPGASRVTDVATQLHFTDLGRFAAGYKQLFHESPSMTLARKPRGEGLKRFVDTFNEKLSR